MMRKCLHRWIALAIPIVFSIVTISGCTGTKAPGKKIKVGLLFPMKGGLGGAGENRVIAAKVALEEINEAGGVLDSELELVLKDTESNPETAKMRAKELVDEGV
ncbi:ABC transporter substrate-binding protein, partial [candidate division WOR-3 bacterium]|nr:ABC transporter substrate-binding protein [candidate division WOR-3 bacterium]